MKQLFIILLTCVCLSMSGCANIQFKPQTEVMLAQLTALNIGSEFARTNPNRVGDALDFCDVLLESEGNFEALFVIAKTELVKVIGDDPTRQASLQIILDSVVLEGEVDIKNGKVVVLYFRKGLLLRK
ncbi:hypothetical protein [Pseudoalteromonas sp.]|uniref:hypothetical protein n=1 Tax=Pseudoalteromonas sp. TaxID=53249 RepID=UPI002603BAB6|nr:hypothetical protein [Pseudoalteromonas sp.]MCP4585311.1 hypothetical protein [Pseudoalteromonas sp.]